MIFVAGGAGYIGSAYLRGAAERGRGCHRVRPTLRTAVAEALERVKAITGKAAQSRWKGDMPRRRGPEAGFGRRRVRQAVIRLAGLKAVGESEADPSAVLRRRRGGNHAFVGVHEGDSTSNSSVFSSSATVYGVPAVSAVHAEKHPCLRPTRTAKPSWR